MSSSGLTNYEPKVWEFKTFDKRSWALTQREYDAIKEKMRQGKAVYEMPDGSLIAKGNLSGMEKRQMTMADAHNEAKGLPKGDYKVNVDGPGFKKFVAAAKKLNPKFYKKKMAEWGMDENGTYLETKESNENSK